jgi:K(+)-stimulated pyrophosphate-energized sodium pump
MNPIIKFTTLFGLLAVEMAVGMMTQGQQVLAWGLAAVFLALNLIFVYRSFYGMRINQ